MRRSLKPRLPQSITATNMCWVSYHHKQFPSCHAADDTIIIHIIHIIHSNSLTDEYVGPLRHLIVVLYIALSSSQEACIRPRDVWQTHLSYGTIRVLGMQRHSRPGIDKGSRNDWPRLSRPGHTSRELLKFHEYS